MNEQDKQFLLEMLDKIITKNGKKNSSLTTHPAKINNPSANVSNIIARTVRSNDGLVYSGNVNTTDNMDSTGNGAFNKTLFNGYKVLSKALGDYDSILEHLKTESDEVKEFLSPLGRDFKELKEKLLFILENHSQKTDGRIRQVYFPIDNEAIDPDYHILSILPSASIMGEMHDRIKLMYNKEAKELQKNRRENKEGPSHGLLLGLTQINFGGSKPQNISAINNSKGGVFYLLPTIPPLIKIRKIRLPKNDFFQQSIPLKEFHTEFEELHKIFVNKRNNIEIRNKIKNKIYKMLMEKIIYIATQIRDSNQENWSEKSAIPLYQKIWLDEYYVERRNNESEWLEKIIKEMARWFTKSYQKQLAKEACSLDDDEINYIARKIIKPNCELLR